MAEKRQQITIDEEEIPETAEVAEVEPEESHGSEEVDKASEAMATEDESEFQEEPTAEESDDQYAGSNSQIKATETPLLLPSTTEQRRMPWRILLVVFGLIVIVVLAVVLLSGKSKPVTKTSGINWTRYTNSVGHFSSLFPVAPDLTTKNVVSGGVNYTESTWQAPWKNAVYQVVYTSPEQESDDYPTLDKLVQTTVQNLQGGQLIMSSHTTVSGFNAETFQITGLKNGNDVYLSGEFVVAGNIQYALLASQYYAIAPQANYFLSSFSINR
ncbi:MAG TPA: hypothetical protein VFN31_02680 [Candidatus Saccharimonadales bacterium]|nr:hypothetical protein [Candidatus Saccharimonadales bacterium]